MEFFYDLHMHSGLSPCADSDMTPNNIVNMAYLKGLNIIAVTDHNSVLNYPAVRTVAESIGIEAVPGMEVTTKEEVHVLCYFKEYTDALKVSESVYKSLPDISNKPDIFGEQCIYDKKDQVVGILDKLLINASSYTLDKLFCLVSQNNGVAVPAHINKKSNGILGVLGFVPFDLDIKFVELKDKSAVSEKLIKKYGIFNNSDAHQLIDISESRNSLILDSKKSIYGFLGL